MPQAAEVVAKLVGQAMVGPPPDPAEIAAATPVQPSRFSLPIGTHLALVIAGGIVGFLVGGVASLALTWVYHPHGLLGMMAFFGPVFLGFSLVRLGIKTFIPARCPVCQGNARVEGHSPIQYRCTRCGHVHKTGIVESTEVG